MLQYKYITSRKHSGNAKHNRQSEAAEKSSFEVQTEIRNNRSNEER